MSILNKFRLLPIISHSTSKILTCTQSRPSSFRSSDFVCDLETPKLKYEVSRNAEEWKYVERLLPPMTVPGPLQKTEYLSEWRPQGEESKDLPYYIPRNKNHMIPVYMETSNRGLKRLTYVKKVQGDIWLLEGELREFLQEDSKRPIRTQVNELVGYICLHGDHVNAIKYYLMKKNL